MQFETYVINLDGSDDRMAQMARQLADEGIAYRRISAVDGRKRAATDFPQYDDPRARSYFARALHGAEVACTLSHICALQQFLDSDAEHAIVFEDDIHIKPDFLEVLARTVSELSAAQPDWGLLHLHPKKWRYPTAIARFSARTIYQLHAFPTGTGAIVYSRKGARAAVDGASRIYAPWDVYLKDVVAIHGNGFGLSPHLVATPPVQSEISPVSGTRDKIKGALGWLRKQRRVIRHGAIGLGRWLKAGGFGKL